MTVHFRLNLELCVNPYSYLTHKTTYDYITRSTYSVYREVTIFDLFCVYWRWGKSMGGAWESAFCCNRSLSCWPCSSMFASKVAICSFSQLFADQVLTAVSPPLHQLYHPWLAICAGTWHATSQQVLSADQQFHPPQIMIQQCLLITWPCICAYITLSLTSHFI